MAFDITNTLRKVESFLAGSGYFSNTGIGEPSSPPDQLSAHIWMTSVDTPEIPLDGGDIQHHVVMVRIYKPAFEDPTEDIELELSNTLSQLLSDILGDADLGATVRHVDAGGIYGTTLAAQWGHLDQNGRIYRVVDVSLPLVVDGSSTISV